MTPRPYIAEILAPDYDPDFHHVIGQRVFRAYPHATLEEAVEELQFWLKTWDYSGRIALPGGYTLTLLPPSPTPTLIPREEQQNLDPSGSHTHYQPGPNGTSWS